MTSLSTLQREDTLDLTQLAAELERRQATKRDYVADTRRVGFSSFESFSSVTIDGVEGEMPMIGPDADGAYVAGWKVRDHAHGQIATKLGIPKKYYDRLRADAPSLLDTNVRHWLINEPGRQMFRTLDGEVRAVVSDRFRRLDDYDLMERAILPALQDVAGLTFHVASLTPERLTIRAILPSLERQIKRGDVVQAGVQIRNSEVGAGRLLIEPYLWRLVCLNGMVSSVGQLAAYHVGRKIEDNDENRGIYRQDTLAADDKAFFLKARDAVKAAVTETRFEEIVAGLREIATGERIVAPAAATERLAATLDLTEGEGQSMLAALAEGGDLTQWGAVNALTASAKQAPTFERQQELEVAGGRLAAMDRGAWEKIAVAV